MLTVEPRLDDARCALHPGREALQPCTRCGNFLCAVCISSDAGRIVCVTCANRALARGTSRRAVGSLVLSLLAVALMAGAGLARQPLGCLALPLSALGLGLGLVELNAIRAGAAPAEGRRVAQLGVALGLVAVLAALAFTLFAPR
jgi:hypothetical protein